MVPEFIESIGANLVDFIILMLGIVLVSVMWVLPFVIWVGFVYGIYCLFEKIICYIKGRA